MAQNFRRFGNFSCLSHAAHEAMGLTPNLHRSVVMWIDRSTLCEAAVVGVGATAVMEIGAEILRRARGVQPLNYGLLGQWIGHMPKGVFRHEAIHAASEVPCEKQLGWAAHYGIGTGFAVALIMLQPSWLDRLTPAPALAMGLGTVAAPWLLMQPAFGMGIAAAKTPAPWLARRRSLRAHAIYGGGLWVSALLLRAVVQRK